MHPGGYNIPENMFIYTVHFFDKNLNLAVRNKNDDQSIKLNSDNKLPIGCVNTFCSEYICSHCFR